MLKSREKTVYGFSGIFVVGESIIFEKRKFYLLSAGKNDQ